ncbi:Protein argonaute 4A [Camellia lanceoleosa]|uniref:Protein argonaute 4A n=1 Tax=Camellia lanceoleosa TaxID=1840588 RepID=A0ACC0FR15_9ERIC|nr:Protein argonaute 4A [Camellia lanceoleosa]
MRVYLSSAPYVGFGAPSSMYMGVPPYGSSLFNGSSMSPYDDPFSGVLILTTMAGKNLQYSGDLPCINVGKPKRPTYFPLELCSLVSLQRYTKALSTFQRSSLVEKSRKKPQERMRVLSDLKVGNGEDFFPRNGRWNFNNKKLVDPTKIDRWAVLNFSTRCDIRGLVRDLIKCGDMKGILCPVIYSSLTQGAFIGVLCDNREKEA